MYLMITSVCNMSCAHCCMSCGVNYKGQHMSQEVFTAALAWGEETGQYIALGGGEPTLHPQFISYLAQSIEYTQQKGIDLNPWFATNGSKTRMVRELLYNSVSIEEEFFEELSRHAFINYEDILFDMAVSQDEYHEPIDASIPQLAKTLSSELRNTSNSLSNTGHCTHGEDHCACNTVQIKPDGDIFLCGCDDAPLIGNVLTGMLIDFEELYAEMDDICIQEINEDTRHLFESVDMTQTNSAWVTKNLPIRKGKENHPDTHRKIN